LGETILLLIIDHIIKFQSVILEKTDFLLLMQEGFVLNFKFSVNMVVIYILEAETDFVPRKRQLLLSGKTADCSFPG
jgi:hypothetical protein